MRLIAESLSTVALVGGYSQAKAYSNKYSLSQHQLIVLVTEACHHHSKGDQECPCEHDGSHVASIEKWASEDSHKKEQESLHRSNPCYLGGRFSWDQALRIMGFEYAE